MATPGRVHVIPAPAARGESDSTDSDTYSPWMTCCTPTGYRTIFGAKTAERDARRYRRKGLTGSARWLSEALRRDGVVDRSVLEIGGGIGALQLELLGAGASHSANVEIIDTYEAAARRLIEERNLDERIDRRVGDFALHPDEAATAHIVVLHRVICCYPDPHALVAAACAHSLDRVAITIPRQSWWVKLAFASMNWWFRRRRVGFQAFVHPLHPMLQTADAGGFHLARQDRGPVWESMILVCA